MQRKRTATWGGLLGLLKAHWQGELSVGRTLLFAPLLIAMPLVACLVLLWIAGMPFDGRLLDRKIIRLVLFAGVIGSLSGAFWWCRGAHQKALHLMANSGLGVAATVYSAAMLGGYVLFFMLIPTTCSEIGSEIQIMQAERELMSRAASSRRHKPWEVNAYPELGRIVASGPIGWGSAKALDQALLANPDIRILELDSPGGYVHEENLLIDIVRRHQLDTFVRDRCYSACTGVYLAGETRFITQEAKFGFHQSGYRQRPKNTVWDIPEYETSIFYREKNMPEEFMQKALSTSYYDLWMPHALDLKQYGYATAWWSDRPANLR